MAKVTQFPSYATLILAALALIPCPGRAVAGTITEVVWGHLADGRSVRKFTLTNAHDTRVVVAEYGALLVSVETKDQEGRVGHTTLSYQSLDEALAGGVFGSVIGRFANRISSGGFTIDGKRYDLASVNQDGISIHGGATGFHRQLWKGEATPGGVTFSLTSADGHEGYPGQVEVSVTYTLTDENVLRLDYAGTTDRPTHLNLTNHVYFNLAGTGDIRGHDLEMHGGQILAIDESKIPTGAFLDVTGTPFDFRVKKPLGRDITSVAGGGYDHCWVIPLGPETLAPFAKLSDPASGRTLEIATTQPGVQIFTANSFKDNPHPRWGGICFETQSYPDTPNRPEFPSSLLRPGETYRHTTEFRFGVKK